MPAFQAEPGMPYWIDLTTSDLRKASHFYSEILGWEIEELADDYRLARIQGLPVAGLVQRPEESQQPDTWVTYFQTDDISTSLRKIVDNGGRVLLEATQVRLGEMAVVVDSSGAMFGLIQPAGEDSFIAAGEPGTPVWHELTATTSYEQALEFYPAMFGWTVAETEDHSYATALAEGSAFAGIYNAVGHFPPDVPSFWQSFLGVRSVDAIIDRVVELGGDILRAPFDSAFGRMAILVDSTGAILTLCDVAEPVEEGHESDDLLL